MNTRIEFDEQSDTQLALILAKETATDDELRFLLSTFASKIMLKRLCQRDLLRFRGYEKGTGREIYSLPNRAEVVKKPRHRKISAGDNNNLEVLLRRELYVLYLYENRTTLFFQRRPRQPVVKLEQTVAAS